MTVSSASPRQSPSEQLRLAVQAVRMWTPRQVLVAVASAVIVAIIIGVATVLIPNPVFARDIEPVWWNYPVWLLTSALSGMLIATYVRPERATTEATDESTYADDASERRSSRLGLAGGILAWFAVGCPVCNKLALLALGYSGAITWFAPVQPFLALAAMVFTGVALVSRLRGQVACPVRPKQLAAAR